MINRKKSYFVYMLLMMFILAIPLHALATPVGKVTHIEGKVDITKAGGAAARNLLPGESIEVGDAIRTKTRSKAEITFNNNNLLRIAALTRVIIQQYLIQEDNNIGVMKLQRGTAQMISSVEFIKRMVSSPKQNRLEINTMNAVCGIRGSNMIVSYYGGVTSIMFVTGKGYTYNPLKPEIIVPITAGNISFIERKDTTPTLPRPVSDVELNITVKAVTPSEKSEKNSTQSQDIAPPSANVATPAPGITTPVSSTLTPSIGSMTPTSNITTPSIGSTTSTSGITSPGVSSTATPSSTAPPSISGTIPTSSLTAPSVGSATYTPSTPITGLSSSVSSGSTSPGLSGTAPGQTGTSPGLSGSAPGLTGTSPGLSGTAPGLTGTSPGLSGSVPGLTGTSPGLSGTAPGQTGTFPGLSGSAPGLTGTSPGLSGTAPGLTGTSPGLSGSAPGLTGTSPGLSGTAPGLTGTSPGLSGTAPGQTGTAPIQNKGKTR